MKYTMLRLGVLLALASPAATQWSDNFDSYANNTLLNGVGGWAGWDNTSAAAGSASNAFARSAPNSILIGPAADAVHPALGATNGRWVLSAWQYIPTGSLTANTWLIVNNRYNHGGPYSWSCQFRANSTTSMIEDVQAGGRRTTPQAVVFDKWVEWRLEIDLDRNTIVACYDGKLLSEGTYVTAATAPVAIDNIDLYSQGATCYYDDIALTQTWWSDDFESYASNTLLDNVGGWAGWDNTSAAAGTATSAFARSGANSILIGPAADAVHPNLGATSGRWTLKGWQYIPTGSLTANTWVIVNNQYNHGGPYSWSCQFRANSTTSMIEDVQAGGRVTSPLPVVFDRWVEWRLDIDLDLNTIAAYYDGLLLSQGTYVTSATAPVAIENLDLYSQGATCYFDDISLTGTSWSDNLDTYANSTLLDNVGGWAGWDNSSAAAGTASTAFARSLPNSILIGPAADAVHPGLGAKTGRWVLRAWQYIPTGSLTANTWFIVNNQYNHGGPYSWACQFRANSATSMIEDVQAGGRITNPQPVVFDAWVEWRMEIDLDLNTIAAYYNGQQVSLGTYVTSTTAPVAIENIDLYSQGATCYFDDISLHEATDTFGLSASQATGSTTLNLWVNEPSAASSVSALVVSVTNTSAPYKLNPLISGWVWMDSATMVLLGIVPVDARGRASLSATVPTLGLNFAAWAQAFSMGPRLTASDAIAVSDGDDGTSSATIVYNVNDGRYTVQYEGPSSCVLTHLPSNNVIANIGKGGYTGKMFLGSGESLVVTEKVTSKELTRATKK